MNRECNYCGKHVWFEEYESDACHPSPTGYHRNDLHTWLDRSDWSIGTPDRIDAYAWASRAFEPLEGDDAWSAPTGMRRALTRLFGCYPNMPRGLCDPMYITNVIAHEMAVSA